MDKFKETLKGIWKRGAFYIILLGVFLLIVLFASFLGKVIIVQGTSMEPTYHNGDIGLAFKVYNADNINVGDVVVFQYEGIEVIKRVAEDRGTAFWVLGDNAPESFDSRDFGEVDKARIEYKVAFVAPSTMKYVILVGFIVMVVMIFVMAPRRRARKDAEKLAREIDEFDDDI